MAGGAFTSAGGSAASGVARFDGVAWGPLDGGVDSAVDAVCFGAGSLHAGGQFQQAGGQPAAFLAQLSTPCAAAVAPVGAACGGVTLLPESLAWSGGAFRARGAGFAANAIVLAVTGVGPTSTPLPGLLPQALPGCLLSASPDALAVFVGHGREVVTEVPIPSESAAPGQTFDQQLIVLDLAGLAITTATSSNGLRATVGVF